MCKHYILYLFLQERKTNLTFSSRNFCQMKVGGNFNKNKESFVNWRIFWRDELWHTKKITTKKNRVLHFKSHDNKAKFLYLDIIGPLVEPSFGLWLAFFGLFGLFGSFFSLTIVGRWGGQWGTRGGQGQGLGVHVLGCYYDAVRTHWAWRRWGLGGRPRVTLFSRQFGRESGKDWSSSSFLTWEKDFLHNLFHSFEFSCSVDVALCARSIPSMPALANGRLGNYRLYWAHATQELSSAVVRNDTKTFS